MTRRILAAAAAVLLAAAGAWVILGYVQGADARAQAGEELSTVLVVTTEVPVGTPVAELADSVGAEQVPARLVAPGALADLDAVSGLVTTAELLPGEQVLPGRFGDPSARRADGSLPTPDGLVEVSAALEPQRAAGGTLVPGDEVGVTLTSEDSAATGLGAFSTFQVLHDVLVTRVTAPTDAAGTWTVTLAVSPADASTVVIGLTAQSVWLSLETSGGGSTSATTTTTSASITGDDQ